MTQTSHIEPSKHSTPEVDEKLRQVEQRIENTDGAGSPAIKPVEDVAADGKPLSDTPRNPKL